MSVTLDLRSLQRAGKVQGTNGTTRKKKKREPMNARGDHGERRRVTREW